MRFGTISSRRYRFLTVLVAGLVATAVGRATAQSRPSTGSWGGDGAAARPGEIVIKATGRKVRVVTLSTSPSSIPAVVKRPQAPVHREVSVVFVRQSLPSMDEGLEYGEQSVRLPYEYDPREQLHGGWGPYINMPIGYGPDAYSGGRYSGYGFGYGGYGGYGCGGYGNGGYGRNK